MGDASAPAEDVDAGSPYSVESLSPPVQSFFAQRCVARCGLPVLAAACVAPAALREAARRADAALASLPAVAGRLASLGTAIHVIGARQACSDLPQFAHLRTGDPAARAAFDARGRGYGGLCPSCGEENLLRLPCDRYPDHRDILSHELSHTIMDWGYAPSRAALLRARVEAVRVASLAAGRWADAYAGSNASEFFAEAAMWHLGSRGDAGCMADPPVVEGRAWLEAHDPDAAALLAGVFSGAFPPPAAPRGSGDAGDGDDDEAVVELRRAARGARSGGGAASRVACTMLVVNATAAPLTLSWRPPQRGVAAVPYACVPPGGVAGQTTYVGHAWELTEAAAADDADVAAAADVSPRCRGVYVARAGVCRVRVREETTSDDSDADAASADEDEADSDDEVAAAARAVVALALRAVLQAEAADVAQEAAAERRAWPRRALPDGG